MKLKIRPAVLSEASSTSILEIHCSIRPYPNIREQGYRVYAQGGYFNPKPFAQYSELEKRLHLVDLALNDNPQFQTPARFPVLPWMNSSQGKDAVLLISRLEKEKMTAIAGQDMEIVSLVFDSNNNLLALKKDKITISNLATDVSFYWAEFPLPPGRYNCRVVIRNLETGQAAVGSAMIAVPGSESGRPRLSAPLFLKSEKPVFWPRTPSPLHLLTQTSLSPAEPTWPDGTSSLLAMVRCNVPGIEKPEVEISSYLVSKATAERIPVMVCAQNKWKESDGEIQLLELQPESLPAGEYFLYIWARETKTGTSSYTTSPLIVR